MKLNLQTLMSVLAIGGVVYSIIANHVTRNNHIKHIDDKLKSIASWQHEKSLIIDKMDNRLIKMETACNLRHKNGGE
jgi:uncharacterized protein YgiM (DUF1202 family)